MLGAGGGTAGAAVARKILEIKAVRVFRRGADVSAVLECPLAFRVQYGRKNHSPENS